MESGRAKGRKPSRYCRGLHHRVHGMDLAGGIWEQMFCSGHMSSRPEAASQWAYGHFGSRATDMHDGLHTSAILFISLTL